MKQHLFLGNNQKQAGSHGNSSHAKVKELLETGFSMMGHAKGL
jgi:hypothetical protein